MSATTTTPGRKRRTGAISISAYYRQLRAEGKPHDETIRVCCEIYGYHGQEANVSKWLAQARHDFEHPPPAPEPEVKVTLERAGSRRSASASTATDPLDALEHDARARVAQLEEQRARLSLDTHIGDEHGRAEVRLELLSVESELTAARGELERLPLARAEREHRKRDAVQEAEQAARARAAKEVARLEQRLPSAAAEVDAKAAELGKAIAQHADLSDRAYEARVRSWGQKPNRTRPHPPYTGPVRHGLAAAGVPGAVEFAQTHGPAGPLAQETA